MSDQKSQAFLNDILEAAKRIADYIGDMAYEAFLKDLKTQDAVMRNLDAQSNTCTLLRSGMHYKD